VPPQHARLYLQVRTPSETRSMRLVLFLLLLAVFALAAGCSPGGGRVNDEPVSSLNNAGEPALAPDPRLAGQWRAVLTTSVDPRPLDLSITLAGDAPQVMMTSPDQGGAVIAFEQVRLDGPRIGFATRLGALRFEGALQGDDVISGEVHQGGYTTPLSWTRAE
jgi:hypothetical protein